MLENSLERISHGIFEFVSGKVKTKKGILVKKHSENLQMLGDFSFPNTVKSWHELLDKDYDLDNVSDTLLKSLSKKPEDLVDISKDWEIPVKNTKEIKDRVHVFLLRSAAIKTGLQHSFKNNDVILQNIQLSQSANVHLDPLCEDANCITSLRLQCLTKCIQNLYLLNEECKKMRPNVIVSSKSSSKSKENVMVLCGTVLNSRTCAKENTVLADEFLQLRQNEMTLIAQHKYGVRVSSDSKWKDFIAHLGESAVKFELLQTKPSSALKINLDHSSSGSSKGASFVLYNCARLETIIKTYSEKVQEGSYPQLPDINSIDFGLLSLEEEWTLVFNYILGLPNLIEMCVEVNEKTCEFRPHHICSFLSSMVRVFSQYYRKVRILTEPRRHMLPVMFARIHLLKALNETLKTCLRILNIKSVSQM